MIKKLQLNQIDRHQWTTLLSRSKNASLMHGCQFLDWQESLGNKTVIYQLLKNNTPSLALLLTNFKTFGPFYLSSYYPLAPYSSIIEFSKSTDQDYAALIEEVKKDLNPFCLSMKLSDCNNLLPHINHATHLTHTKIFLTVKPEMEMYSNFDSSLKRYLKKYSTHFQIVPVSEKNISEVYSVIKKRDQNLKIITHPLSFYRSLLSLQNQGIIRWSASMIDDKIVAMALFWHSDRQLIYADGATDRDAFAQIYPKAEVLIWEALKWAARSKITEFILGEAVGSGSGNQNFKKKWGALEKPYLVYSFDSLLYSASYHLQPIIKKFWRPY